MSAQNQTKTSFGRAAAGIAIPAALQSMLQASFSAIDQLMIGQLGSVSVAGVGLAGKLGSAASVVVAAVAGVAGVMMAQALGQDDRPEARRSFFLNLAVALALAGVFTIVSALWPAGVMRLYTDDARTVAEATAYLRVLSLSFLPSAGMAMLAALLRCMELASLPLLASAAAALLNTALNWVLIFGHLGAPAMGAVGAAVATVISQAAGMALMLVLLLRCRSAITGGTHTGARVSGGAYARILLPALACEGLWTLGENAYAAIYGHLGTAACAAMTLTGPVQNMAIGALCGLSQAAAILVGKRLGAGDGEGAADAAKRLLRAGLAGALAVSGLILLGRGAYASLVQVEPQVQEMTVRLLAVYALVMPVKVLNMILGSGVLRSGGRTELVMVIDIVGTWGFGVPLGLIGAFWLRLPIPAVYALLSLEECVRLAMGLFVFRRGMWKRRLAGQQEPPMQR